MLLCWGGDIFVFRGAGEPPFLPRVRTSGSGCVAKFLSDRKLTSHLTGSPSGRLRVVVAILFGRRIGGCETSFRGGVEIREESFHEVIEPC